MDFWNYSYRPFSNISWRVNTKGPQNFYISSCSCRSKPRPCTEHPASDKYIAHFFTLFPKRRWESQFPVSFSSEWPSVGQTSGLIFSNWPALILLAFYFDLKHNCFGSATEVNWVTQQLLILQIWYSSYSSHLSLIESYLNNEIVITTVWIFIDVINVFLRFLFSPRI